MYIEGIHDSAKMSVIAKHKNIEEVRDPAKMSLIATQKQVTNFPIHNQVIKTPKKNESLYYREILQR